MTNPFERLRSAVAGRYEVEREIGRGGMATVYLAHDTKHGRPVAIKVLRPELAAAVGAERFVQEIMIAARLNHPHILPLLDSGTVDAGFGEPSPYYTMPFVDGESLRARITRERQLPIEDVLRLGQETADALAYAHDFGVVHRDIKPENILLSNGHAIVADFGIARALRQAGGEKLTSTGIAVGTPAYMSPEQASADDAIDGRTDIYSLGCVLYEAVAGNPPFQGSTAQAILARRMTESAPRLRAVRETVPDSLERAISKAMARLPADRFLTARAFGQALAPGAVETTTADPEPFQIAPSPWGGWRAQVGTGVVGAGLGALLVAGIFIYATRRGDSAPERAVRAAIELPSSDTLVVESGVDHAPSVALSPDGQRLVYVARSRGSGSLLYVRSMDRYQSTPIAGTDGASNPMVSPNGRWVAFFAEGKLKKVSLDGGQPVTLCAASDPEGLDWETDNVLLLTQFNSPLLRVPAVGGQPLAIGKLEHGEFWHAWPQVLPGSNTALYVSASANGSRIMEVSLATGEHRVVLENAVFARSIAGHLLYVRDGVLFARGFDLSHLTLSGTAIPVLEDLFILDEVVPQMSVSRAGDLVYLPGSGAPPPSALRWVDRRGASTPLPVPARRYASPRISPDGRRIAAAVLVGPGRGEILILDPLRDRPTQLPFNGGYSNPVWTMDGTRVVFGSSVGGALSLFVQPVDGSAAATRLLENSNDQWAGSISPDGRTLIYMESNPRTQGDILMVPLDGQHTPRAVVHSAATEWGGRVSPNGRWLAYVSDEFGPFDVYVTSFPNAVGKWRVSTNGGLEAVWSRNGEELFYRQHDGSMMTVSVETASAFSASAPKLLFKGAFGAGTPGVPGYDVAPDGTHFLMLRSVTTSVPSRINVVFGWTAELARAVRITSR